MNDYGWILKSEFTNSSVKLEIECQNGHVENLSYLDFKRRRIKNCKKCNNPYAELWESRIGLTFNELTVVNILTNGMCDFKCSCGKVVSIKFSDVKNGKTKSCGHLKEQMKYKNMVGEKFNHLLAIEELGFNSKNQREYLFLCDCGKTVIRELKEVKRGKLKSCGCMKGVGAGGKVIHGLSKDRLYNIYKRMIRRCYTKNDSSYKDYGGRGIIVCEEWLDKNNGVHNFYKWANENGYTDELTIDRIDNDGNYEPSNCRWVNIDVQANNKRSNLLWEHKGEIKTLAQWADDLDLIYDSLWKRLYKYRYSFEKAITYKTNKISNKKHIR